MEVLVLDLDTQKTEKDYKRAVTHSVSKVIPVLDYKFHRWSTVAMMLCWHLPFLHVSGINAIRWSDCHNPFVRSHTHWLLN